MLSFYYTFYSEIFPNEIKCFTVEFHSGSESFHRASYLRHTICLASLKGYLDMEYQLAFTAKTVYRQAFWLYTIFAIKGQKNKADFIFVENVKKLFVHLHD